VTAVSREIQLRIATAGAAAVDGNVELTLGLSDLTEAPVVYGPTVRPIEGASEMRPYPVHVLDAEGALSAAFVDGGRWVMIGRLADLQYRDDGGSWVTYGTGRIAQVDEDGPGAFRIEIADESWKARRGGVFEVADTTLFWPARPTGGWRGWNPTGAAFNDLLIGRPIDGTVGGGAACLRLTALRLAQGKEITPAFVRFAENDLIDQPVASTNAAEAGNFKTLRVWYGGIDYPVISFSRSLPGIVGSPTNFSVDPLQALKEPEVRLFDPDSLPPEPPLPWVPPEYPVLDPEEYPPYSPAREVTIYVWIVADFDDLPLGGRAFISSRGAPPSPENPLHIGMATQSAYDVSHVNTWGTDEGGIHPATLTRRVWDALDLAYDDSSLTALEADTSLPRLWLRVTETPENVEEWMQAHVWGPLLLSPGRDLAGRRTLIDLRIDPDIDVEELPVITAANARAGSWSLVGSGAINSIEFRYLHTDRPPADNSGAGSAADVRADGFIVEERSAKRIQGDTIEAIGERVHIVSLLGALEPTAHAIRRSYRYLDAGVVFEEITPVLAQEILDLFQDGPVMGRIEVGRSVAEGLIEGDVVVLDHESLAIPNPATGARSGLRLVRVLTMDRHPAFGAIEYLDMGPKAVPLAAPTVSVVQDGEEIVVTVGSVPGGADAVIEAAYTDGGAPVGWPRRERITGGGVVRFGDAPGAGSAYVRARSVQLGRINSPWATDNVALAGQPRLQSFRVLVDAGGRVILSGIPNSFAQGVRFRWMTHLPSEGVQGEGDYFDGPRDFSAASVAAGGLILTVPGTKPDTTVPVIVESGHVITIEAEPWTVFSGGEVSGTAGPVVALTRGRKLFDRPLAPTIEFVVENTYLGAGDTEGIGREKDGPVDEFGRKKPLLPQDWLGGLTVLPSYTGSVQEFDAQGRSSSGGELDIGSTPLDGFDLDRIGFERPGKMSIDLGFVIRDPSGAGGTLYVWTNPASPRHADPTASPDAVIAVASTPAEIPSSTEPDALERVRIPSTGFGQKRMYARFDSVAGATSGITPPLDEGFRALASSSGAINDGDRRGTGADQGGFDTRYAERMAIIEEMHRDFVAGFVGERYLTPKQIKDAEGLFTLMDGEGGTIQNLVIEDTVTDEGLRQVSLFLAKPSSADPDDLDSVDDGAVYRRVLSVDSEGKVTAESIAAAAVEAIHLNVGTIDEITDDLGVIVNAQLVGSSVILDLNAESSDPILESANLAVYADGSAFFAGALFLDNAFGADIQFDDGVDFIGLIDGSNLAAPNAAKVLGVRAEEWLTLTGAFVNLGGDVYFGADPYASSNADGPISFGANDSGGSGFRLLRIPNT
jgi:hypothetical protein